MKKRIALVETWTNPIFVQFANALAQQNPSWEVHFITDADAPKPAVPFHSTVHVTRLRNIRAVRRLVYFPLWLGSAFSSWCRAKYADTLYLHTYSGLSRALDTIAPDVIQANVLLMPCTMQAGRYARKKNIPFILRTEEQHVGGVLGRLLLRCVLWLNRKTLAHTALLLPWTKHGEQFVTAQFPSVAPITLLPAGVDTALFTPKKRYTKKTPLRLLCIQRFVTYKDYPTLLSAVRIARSRGAQVTLSILGSGPTENDVRSLVAELGLSDIVTFLKQTPYTHMRTVMHAHDALILSARHEAIGMVVPEAMACGLPVIVNQTAGAAVYVTKQTGFLFRSGDARDLARSIASLTPSTIHTMGVAAQARIATQFSVAATARTYTALIKNIFVENTHDKKSPHHRRR